MRKLIFLALVSMALLSILFLLYLSLIQEGTPPLWLFMIYMFMTFFSIGFLFGNLNALAMEPLGNLAGIGSALLGFVQTTIAVFVGIFLGRYFHDSVIPLVLSFGVISLIGISILGIENRFKTTTS